MSKRTKHNRLSSFTLEEGDNISLSQGGFDILEGVATSTGMEHRAGNGISGVSITYYPEVEFWVAIKAVSIGPVQDSSVIAKSVIGDDLMLRPSQGYDANPTASGDNIDLQADDVIVGCFSKIRICDAVSYIQAYRG